MLNLTNLHAAEISYLKYYFDSVPRTFFRNWLGKKSFSPLNFYFFIVELVPLVSIETRFPKAKC